MRAPFRTLWLGLLLALALLPGAVWAQVPLVPVANFVGTPISGVAPLTVQFTDLSTNGPTAWTWSFGDGGNSTFQNPSNTYQGPGVYTVSLTARNQSGGNLMTKVNYITVLRTPPTSPVVAFSATPLSGPAPLTVRFADQTTNSPTSWLWSFGDGSTSTQQNPTHTYSRVGTFSVTLTARNATGSASLAKANLISVNATVTPPPVADFTASPKSGTVPLAVTFTDRSDNGPTAWNWNFGDGSARVVTQDATHTYTQVGSFTVTLTVSNAGGSDTKTSSNPILVTFGDVPANFWALNQILAVVNAGIAQGFPGGLFQPGLPLTRDQAAVFLARGIAGGDAKVPAGPSTATFSDVPTSNFAFRYIEFVAARGIMTGFPDGTFRPTEPVTRADLATFVARVRAGGDANVPAFIGTPSFSDVPADSPALEYIEYAKTQGLIRGFPDGSFQPDMVVTRDQMAVFLARVFRLGV